MLGDQISATKLLRPIVVDPDTRIPIYSYVVINYWYITTVFSFQSEFLISVMCTRTVLVLIETEQMNFVVVLHELCRDEFSLNELCRSEYLFR